MADDADNAPTNADWDAWLLDLRRREARGEVKVQWHRAKEPHCRHPVIDGAGRIRYYQPASHCSTCKDGDELREWREYWRSLGAPTGRRNTPDKG